MKSRSHEVGILLLLLTLLESWQYYPLLALIVLYKILSRRGRIPRQPTASLLSLLLLIVSGLVFAANNTSYEVLKDLWYASKVVLALLVGILIGFTSKQDYRFLEIVSIYAGLALVVELAISVLSLVSGQVYVLLPSLSPLFIIIFYLFSKPTMPSRKLPLKVALGTLVLAVLFLSLSRTMLITALITVIGSARIFESRIKILSTATVLIVAMVIFAPLLPKYDPNAITFLGKIQNSLTEIWFVRNDDITNIVSNWRGFEARQAYQTWLSGSFGQMLFGQGLGSPIDIGFYYSLSESYNVRYLPLIHNGYFMILVKYGILGLALFIFSMSFPFLFRSQISSYFSYLTQNIGRTASVILLITTLSITGPFNISKLDGIMLMLGWAIGMHAQIRLLFPTQGRKSINTAKEVVVFNHK